MAPPVALIAWPADPTAASQQLLRFMVCCVVDAGVVFPAGPPSPVATVQRFLAGELDDFDLDVAAGAWRERTEPVAALARCMLEASPSTSRPWGELLRAFVAHAAALGAYPVACEARRALAFGYRRAHWDPPPASWTEGDDLAQSKWHVQSAVDLVEPLGVAFPAWRPDPLATARRYLDGELSADDYQAASTAWHEEVERRQGLPPRSAEVSSIGAALLGMPAESPPDCDHMLDYLLDLLRYRRRRN